MSLKKILSKKRMVFLFLFVIMIFLGNKVNFSALVGSPNQFFTLFQFFGPIAGSFLGPVFGAIAVLGAELADFLLAGKAFTLINIVRLAPMLFAAYYFGTRRKNISIIVPVIAIAAFVLHPIGRHVWFFSLYWTIPIIVKILPKKYSTNLLLRSLGSTFTAHAVGGAAWIWTVKMTAEQWILLIPVVAYERLLFASGIVISYVVLNTLLDQLIKRFKWHIPTDTLYVDRRYALSKNMIKLRG